MNQGYWSYLGLELKQRSFSPWRHPSFVFYFLIAVVFVGAAGVWWEIYRIYNYKSGYGNLRIAIYTFFPVLTTTTGLQLIWAEGGMRSMRGFSTFIVMLCLVGLLISMTTQSDTISLITGGICSLVALWLWVIANAKHPDFLDTSNDAPVGGKVDRALKGNLHGYEE